MSLTPRAPAQAEPLPYRPDSAVVFSHLAAEPWAMLLDSAAESPAGWRHDIIAVGPRCTLVTVGETTRIAEGGRVRESPDDPLVLLRETLGWRAADAGLRSAALPFGAGGAIGWFGYDLARRLDNLGLASPLPAGEPQMAVGIYDWALVTDHRAGTTTLVGRAGAPANGARARLLAAAAAPQARPAGPFRVSGAAISNLDAPAYAGCFARVQAHLLAGDCYQVNLARRVAVGGAGDPWRAWLHLRQINPAPFGAWLNTPGLVLLSASPERFLRVRNGRVQTCPIKGTCRRDPDPVQDRALAAALAASPKDRAENLMIVDLLRNDLGRCASLGSVRVPQLFKVASYAGLHHLVSMVTARLADGQDALDLLRACLPGGSVTGAPKRMAMRIIDALEGEARGPYCGAIGWLGHDGAMDTSIAIRTLAFAPETGELRYWAGGGLVADSRCADEWAEIGLKSRAMAALVEHFRDPATVASDTDNGQA